MIERSGSEPLTNGSGPATLREELFREREMEKAIVAMGGGGGGGNDGD